MRLLDEEVLYILTKEFDENDEVDEHFSWYLDEKNSIQCECGFHAINFFERSIGKSFREEDFSVDIKMKLLNDSVDNLQGFFKYKKNQARHPEIFSELFYTPERVTAIIREEGVKLGFWDYNEVPEKIYCIENLNIQIPKIKLQWYLFIIFATQNYQGRDLKKLAERFLKLKKTKNKFAFEIEVNDLARERIKHFARILKKYEIARHEGYNLHLNLFCFNNVTNLFNIVQIFNGYKEDKFTNFDLSKTLALEGLAVKDNFIRQGLFGEILTDKNTLLKYNQIFNLCENLLVKLFEEVAVEENHGLPKDVATSYIIFKYLHDDTAYSDLLLQNFMGLNNFELNVGSKSFEDFGLLYKVVYEINEKKTEL